MSDSARTDFHPEPTARPGRARPQRRRSLETQAASPPRRLRGQARRAPCPRPSRPPRPNVRRLLANKRRRWLAAAAALICGVIGLSVGIATSRS